MAIERVASSATSAMSAAALASGRHTHVSPDGRAVRVSEHERFGRTGTRDMQSTRTHEADGTTTASIDEYISTPSTQHAKSVQVAIRADGTVSQFDLSSQRMHVGSHGVVDSTGIEAHLMKGRAASQRTAVTVQRLRETPRTDGGHDIDQVTLVGVAHGFTGAHALSRDITWSSRTEEATRQAHDGTAELRTRFFAGTQLDAAGNPKAGVIVPWTSTRIPADGRQSVGGSSIRYAPSPGASSDEPTQSLTATTPR